MAEKMVERKADKTALMMVDYLAVQKADLKVWMMAVCLVDDLVAKTVGLLESTMAEKMAA